MTAGWGRGAMGVGLLGAAALWGCDPWITDVIALANGVSLDDPWIATPPAAIADFHDDVDTVVIDMHADSLNSVHGQDTDLERLLQEQDKWHVDIPRLIEGNVTLQVFATATKGSLDTLFGGLYDDPVRYENARDPSVPAQANLVYDGKTYAESYPLMPAESSLYLGKELELPCRTWYGGPDVWSVPLADNPRTGIVDNTCPDFDPERMVLERMLYNADLLWEAAARSTAGNRLRVITDRASLEALLVERQQDQAVVGGLLALEGVYAEPNFVPGEPNTLDLSDFDELYDAGYRMMALTHFLDNGWSGSATGVGDGSQTIEGKLPLSDAGRQLVQAMFDRGVIVDIAHVSPQGVEEILDMALAQGEPLVNSHGGLSELGRGEECATSRNLSDDQLRRMARTGGVVGIGFARKFVCGEKPIDTALAIRHAVDAIDRLADPSDPLYDPAQADIRGVEHVGLGSDFDGLVTAHVDASHLNKITEALMCEKTWYRSNCLERPFGQAETRAILGGNVLRVLREVLE